MSELIGKIIRDYRINDFIGQGGHGVVYKASHVNSDDLVAVKIMLSEHLEDDTMVRRILQEADIIRELEHPYIVPLIESWQDENGIYVVMPWYNGGDLRSYIQNNQPVDLHKISKMLMQVCSALDAAHAIQIIHRDIKPENILLDDDGNAYLSDFGFAKRINNTVEITTAGDVVGTPNYLSPEQIMGYDIGNATDIYALGIMLHEVLDGEHPYADTTSRVQLMLKLVKEDLPQLKNQQLSTTALEEINALIARCTHKNPEKRYQIASEVALDFAEIIAD